MDGQAVDGVNSTPRARRGLDTNKGSNLIQSTTPTQEAFHHHHHHDPTDMVHARRQSSGVPAAGPGSKRLSYDDGSPFDDLPLGKVNPVGIKDEMDEVVYGYALKIA
jgi:hypothetical protein